MTETQEIRNIYKPGVEDVTREMLRRYNIKTIRNNDTQREEMWLYVRPDLQYEFDQINHFFGGDFPKYRNPGREGLYVRAESILVQYSEITAQDLIKEMLTRIDEILTGMEDASEYEKEIRLKGDLIYSLEHRGITQRDVEETLNHIRRRTGIEHQEINPDTHLPLHNGLWNLREGKLEEFTPSLFYTWNVRGKYLYHGASLRNTPKFKKFLQKLIPPKYIPLVLDYLAYCLYPGFPSQMVLILAGLPRMGKGTLIRLLKEMIPEGVVTITMSALLDPQSKFTFEKVENAQVITDPEMERNPHRAVSWTRFLTLFGGDNLDLEKKYVAAKDYVSRAKGVFAANLPLFVNNSPPSRTRIQIVQTLPKPHKERINNYERIIWEEEGDLITSMLIDRLQSLIRRDFSLSRQQTPDDVDRIWDLLAHSAGTFLEENYDDSCSACEMLLTDLEEEYHFWCTQNGIIPEESHEFSRKVFKNYKRKRKKVAVETEGKKTRQDEIWVVGIRRIEEIEEVRATIDPTKAKEVLKKLE